MIIKLCNLRLQRRKPSNSVNRLYFRLSSWLASRSSHVLSGLSGQIPLW